MSVRKTLLAIIHHHQLTQFTIGELKLLSRGQISASSPEQLGTKIYKQVWVLKNEGHLELDKHPTEPQQNTYTLTKSGNDLILSMEFDKLAQPVSTAKSIGLDSLNLKLSKYSSELASASAEAQEYQQLSKEHPELTASIQSKYVSAKERAAMYQGRLSAIENVLRDFE
ncbi:hypothetical protein [Rheinheimera sp.]|uniref:hypothetical protein n=1 Tax=Rheinheimera sp. TaxID=1869214 RepID=UPI0037C9DEA5